MDTKKPIYRRKWFPYVAAVILILAIIPSKDDTEKSAEVEQEQAQPKEKAQQVEEKSEESAQEVVEEVAKIVPLTKDEVLAKFALDSDIKPYIDGSFIFVGNRKDTADYYALADTERYRNASVIFKDGEIARVKFIPEGDTDPVEFLAEFGIVDKPRKLSGRTGYYETALIPLFWSQNIERYPFELD